MEKRQVNPWDWQDRFGYSQAWRVDDPRSIVYIAGQVAVAPDGTILGDADFETQTRQVFENLRAILDQAGATFDDIVKLTNYFTDTSHLPDYRRIKGEFITGRQPASTSIQIPALAFPGLMIEVEAVAVL
jgi:enamine deaminase RidA (YjgF/YER057c/UK114 family)